MNFMAVKKKRKRLRLMIYYVHISFKKDSSLTAVEPGMHCSNLVCQ